MMKKVRISENDLRGLLDFLSEETVREREDNLKELFSFLSEAAPTKKEEPKKMKMEAKRRPVAMRDIEERINHVPSTDELIDMFHEQFISERPYLSNKEKEELGTISNILKGFAKHLEETLGDEVDKDEEDLRKHAETTFSSEREDMEECIVRAVTPEGFKTLGKIVDGKIVPLTKEEEAILERIDSEEAKEVENIFDELNECISDREEPQLLNIYEAARLMVDNSWAYSVNGYIELYKDKNGNVTMSTQSDDINIFEELFDVDDIAVIIESKKEYPIGSEALGEVHKQDPNTKFTFFLNDIDEEIANQFDGEVPRTLSEILTYTYLASNNNTAIYNEVMSNMILRKA